MRVGVYVDGFNLYYGGRANCGKGTSGWRWLDIRALATSICTANRSWTNPQVERIVYCTARVKGPSRRDQSTYINALQSSGSVDVVEYGKFVERVNRGPVAVEDKKGRPKLLHPSWPVRISDHSGNNVDDYRFVVSYARREEKGSDVNVASYLLVDLYEESIDAAFVISNDSDLAFAVRHSRNRIPVGIINPTKSQLVGALKVDRDFGAGNHFSMQLGKDHFYKHQLPDSVGTFRKPQGW